VVPQVSCMEASALNGGNVEAAFLQILTEIYRKKSHKEQEQAAAQGTVTVGGSETKTAERKRGCC